jgi:hypothetical protein
MPFDEVLFGVDDRASRAIQENRRALIKIHGDIDRPIDIAFTSREFDLRYGSAQLERFLSLCSTSGLLFLGCSLQAQDSLLTSMSKIARSTGVFQIAYAVLPAPESTSLRGDRLRKLTELGIQTIWYPARQHESIATLLKFLADASGRNLIPSQVVLPPSPPDKKRSFVHVFISYSHRDEKLRQQLDTHLASLKRNGAIRSWHDRELRAGTPIDDQIAQKIDSADIVLVLISADFIASEYCYVQEMSRAIRRHDKGDARVVPIILRDTDWKSTPLGKLAALPTGGKPIVRWQNRDAAWVDVVKGIRKIIDDMTTAS